MVIIIIFNDKYCIFLDYVLVLGHTDPFRWGIGERIIACQNLTL